MSTVILPSRSELIIPSTSTDTIGFSSRCLLGSLTWLIIIFLVRSSSVELDLIRSQLHDMIIMAQVVQIILFCLSLTKLVLFSRRNNLLGIKMLLLNLA